ncbi:hypothetical protein VNO78_22547 [Psophocarpus tetragonolobus]|uniref:Autophagy-related protein n=1 Tax=Psophocarpus tetragonolobus TaxID=3891 RepID=A0AAN9S303_PSOTE
MEKGKEMVVVVWGGLRDKGRVEWGQRGRKKMKREVEGEGKGGEEFGEGDVGVIEILIKKKTDTVGQKKKLKLEIHKASLCLPSELSSPNPNLIPQSIFPCWVCTMAKNSFKLEHPLERRQAESARIRDKYPDRIPVIVEKAERSDIPDIDKKKYLVPADLTVGQFVYVVRKRIKVSAEKAIFVFINNTLPPTAALMSSIYEENKDDDGFLYMTYSGENTFGFHLGQI